MKNVAAQVYRGGRIWTGDDAGSGAQALAVRDGRIMAVGDDATIAELIGPQTQVVDLAGRMLLPGFQDGHCHPAMGAFDLIRCNLRGATSVDAALEIIAAYAAAHPDQEWILGGGWDMYEFGGKPPTAAQLDSVTGGRPAQFDEVNHHSVWVNSEALRRAGIDRDTPDPVAGTIDRDERGEPTGLLLENAVLLVGAVLPELSVADYEHALLLAQDYYLSCGITAWQDAAVEPLGDTRLGETYLKLDGSGRLKLKTVGALWWQQARGAQQFDDFVAMRERSSDKVRFTTVKFFVDGVIEEGTALLDEPYCQCFRANSHGMSLMTPQESVYNVTELDRLGFQLHFHAIGDRAIRQALDALDAARSANGANDNRHHIAHLQLVDPADRPRFAQLNVTANCQPLWGCFGPEDQKDLTREALGEGRYLQQYPLASLARAGARLAFGSDWNITGAEVFPQLEVATQRRHPDRRSGPVFAGDERLSLDAALRAFTFGSAYVNHLDHVTGTLTAGKLADMCVLDRDLFAEEAGPVGDAQVDATIVEGEVAYARPGADLT